MKRLFILLAVFSYLLVFSLLTAAENESGNVFFPLVFRQPTPTPTPDYRQPHVPPPGMVSLTITRDWAFVSDGLLKVGLEVLNDTPYTVTDIHCSVCICYARWLPPTCIYWEDIYSDIVLAPGESVELYTPGRPYMPLSGPLFRWADARPID